MECVFYTTKMSLPQALDEIEHALEVRTQTLSRARYPRLWNWTDRLSRVPSPQRSKKSRRFEGGVYLLFGVFLLVPGMKDPLMRHLLFPGAIGILAGVWDLYIGSRTAKPQQRRPFAQSARLLLQHAAQVETGQRVVFRDGELEIPADDGVEQIPYSWVEYVLESENLILVTFDDRILLLKQADLVGESMETFRSILDGRVEYIPI